MRFGRNPNGKKKKRIPYDPPGSKARKKANKQANRRVDQLFLTRRAVMMKSAVLGGFSILLARLGYMQIGKGEDYQAAATTNITDWRELKPSRGVIVDRKGRLMAKNRKSWSVSVIPADIRQLESTQLAYVREQLMTALRLPDVVMINPGSIPAEAKDQVYRRVGRLLGDTTEQDYENTKNWIKSQLQIQRLRQIRRHLGRHGRPVQHLPGGSAGCRDRQLSSTTSSATTGTSRLPTCSRPTSPAKWR